MTAATTGGFTARPPHKDVPLAHHGLIARIDEDLVELVHACWAAGIETGESCQEAAPGMARIGFLSLSDMEHLYDVLNTDGDDKIFHGWKWELWADGSLLGIVYFPADRIPWITQQLKAARAVQP